MMPDIKLDKVYEDVIADMLSKGYRTVEDLPAVAPNYPFLYKGMPIREYWIERLYYSAKMKDLSYRPLWVQRGEVHEKYVAPKNR